MQCGNVLESAAAELVDESGILSEELLFFSLQGASFQEQMVLKCFEALLFLGSCPRLHR